jgi:ubiquitin C-terminal hydrolase
MINSKMSKENTSISGSRSGSATAPAAKAPEGQMQYDRQFFTNRGLNGIRNLGNTCYLNSIIQSLSNIVPLTRYFLEREEFEEDMSNSLKRIKKRKTENRDEIPLYFRVTVMWYHLMNKMWKEHAMIEPILFKRTFGEMDSRVHGFGEQDAHEIMLSLLNIMHDSTAVEVEMNISGNFQTEKNQLLRRSFESWKSSWEKQYSKIVELFGGQYYSWIKCPDCNYMSDRFENYYILSLPILDSCRTIYDCFHHFQRLEILDDKNKWKCDKCNDYVNAEMKTEVWKLPNILMIQLKRFHHHRSKIDSLVDFTQDIDLSDYCPITGESHPRYTLISTIHHVGTLNGGHYYTNVRKLNGRWFHFNDNQVRVMGNFGNIDKRSAYILIYQRTS